MKTSEKLRKIRAERLKQLIKERDLKQKDLTFEGDFDLPWSASEICAFCNGRRLITEATVELLTADGSIFADIRPEYLLGHDEYKTTGEKTFSQLYSIAEESENLWVGFSKFLKPWGYTIVNKLDNTEGKIRFIDEVVKTVKDNPIKIYKNGKLVAEGSYEWFNDLRITIGDIAERILQNEADRQKKELAAKAAEEHRKLRNYVNSDQYKED